MQDASRGYDKAAGARAVARPGRQVLQWVRLLRCPPFHAHLEPCENSASLGSGWLVLGPGAGGACCLELCPGGSRRVAAGSQGWLGRWDGERARCNGARSVGRGLAGWCRRGPARRASNAHRKSGHLMAVRARLSEWLARERRDEPADANLEAVPQGCARVAEGKAWRGEQGYSALQPRSQPHLRGRAVRSASPGCRTLTCCTGASNSPGQLYTL